MVHAGMASATVTMDGADYSAKIPAQTIVRAMGNAMKVFARACPATQALIARSKLVHCYLLVMIRPAVVAALATSTQIHVSAIQVFMGHVVNFDVRKVAAGVGLASMTNVFVGHSGEARLAMSATKSQCCWLKHRC